MDRLNNILKERLAAGQVASSEHPSADLLAAFAERNLKTAQRETVLGHLAGCASCREAVMLAMSDVSAAEPADATVSPRAILQFPVAMRWASLAAALAVAVGVGILFNDHASAPKQALRTEASKSAASTQPPPEVANRESGAQNLLANKDLVTHSADRSDVAKERKKASLAKDRDREDLPSAPAAAPASSAIAGISGRLSGYAKLNQAKTDSFVSNQEPKQKLVTTDTAQGTRSVPAPPSPPPVASALSNQPQDANLNARLAQAQPAPAAANQAVEVSAEAPVPRQAETVQIPAKVAPAASVGSVRRVQSSAFRGGMVSWAISETGQLQRTLQDGATTNVQPAPGMTVQAVASEGIEVWAAGAQSDLSAREWTQNSVLLHSSDAGKTWSRVDGPWQGPISQLSLSGKGNLTIYTQKGIWITNDAGKTWVPINVKTKG